MCPVCAALPFVFLTIQPAASLEAQRLTTTVRGSSESESVPAPRDGSSDAVPENWRKATVGTYARVLCVDP